MRKQHTILILAALSLGLTACNNNIDFSELDIPSVDSGNSGLDNNTPGFSQENFIVPTDRPLVDILFVTDNSASMANEQDKLGQKFMNFTQAISDVDWRIAMTTTDNSAGVFATNGQLLSFNQAGLKVLTPGTPDAEALFINTVQRPESKCSGFNCGSSNEQPLAAVNLAIGLANTTNSGFFRPDAALAVVILSDEDESNSNVTGADLVNRVKADFGANKKVRGYGLIVNPNDNACRSESGGRYGSIIDDFVKLTGGVSGSICAPDYAPTLTYIGRNLQSFASSFVLKHKPIDGTVKVTLVPEQPGQSWVVDRQQLVFAVPLAPGSKVFVEYNY